MSPPPDLAATALRALVLYALTEHQGGHARTIRVHLHGARFGLSDDGRGHPLDKTLEGTSYLRFIYTHFDYPFETGAAAPVQLQGIGMSMVNAMCRELTLSVRKRTETLTAVYANGRLASSQRTTVPAQPTGIALAATLHDGLPVHEDSATALAAWLGTLARVHPALTLDFNGTVLQLGDRPFPGGRLRRLRPGDLAAFQAYRALPELGRFQGWSPMTDDAARRFIDEVAHAPLFTPGEWMQLAIADETTDTLIGDIGLHLGADGREAEVGFTLAPQAQGRGIATRAVGEALRLVFAHTAATQVLGITDERNAPSVRLLERLGFTLHERREVVFRGEACVERVYWLARPSEAAPPAGTPSTTPSP